MKKATVLLVALTAMQISFGQSVYAPLSGHPGLFTPAKGTKQQIKEQYKQKFHSSMVRDENWWVCYGLDIDSVNGFIASLSGNYLFSDSNVLVNFSDGYGGTIEGAPWVHMLGDVMDPLAFVFNYVNGVWLSSSDPYYLDSAAMVLAYFRNTDASVVDTLLVYVFSSAVGGSNLPLYYYSGSFFVQNYGYDTVYVPFIKYSKANHRPNAGSALKTFKVPLYEEDSSSFFYFKTFDLNDLYVPANHKVCMAVAFKPGYSYSPNQNIANQYNYIIFASLEENGPGTYQTYFPDEYNVSSIIPTSVRYGIDQYGYNNLFVPSYAYYEAYSFERHLLVYNISDQVTGISDVDIDFANVEVVPNPANTSFELYYTLTRPVGGVTVTLSDLTGKVLWQFNGQGSTGIQHHTVDVQRLKPGIYVVALESDGMRVRQPLVVAR